MGKTWPAAEYVGRKVGSSYGWFLLEERKIVE